MIHVHAEAAKSTKNAVELTHSLFNKWESAVVDSFFIDIYAKSLTLALISTIN